MTSLAGLFMMALLFVQAILRLIACLLLLFPKSEPLNDLSDFSQPKFTILVPLYKEANMVRELMKNLDRLNYPRDKIDIILITEADDLMTNWTIRHYLRPPFQHIIIPHSLPRTKPKALNQAYNRIPPDERGDIITVYDAEDRPHPNQLREAVKALAKDPALVAVQSPLRYANDADNWLTRQFAIEYSILFEVWNPALARLGIIFTLGGTSNHIRREALEAAGGWDAYNVTEDADLSYRLAALNWWGPSGAPIKAKLGTLTLPTEEQAVAKLPQWIAQRSRWIKGYLQTGYVHARPRPLPPNGNNRQSLFHRARSFFSLNVSVIFPLMLAFIHVPSLIALALFFSLPDDHALKNHLELSIPILIVLGYGLAVFIGFIGCLKSGKSHLLSSCLLMPLYWMMLFVPALIAAWEYFFSPHSWRKTPHVPQTPSRSQSDQEFTIAVR